MKNQKTLSVYSLSVIQKIMGFKNKEMLFAVLFARLVFFEAEEMDNGEYYKAVKTLRQHFAKEVSLLKDKGFFSECGMYPSELIEPVLSAVADSLEVLWGSTSKMDH